VKKVDGVLGFPWARGLNFRVRNGNGWSPPLWPSDSSRFRGGIYCL